MSADESTNKAATTGMSRTVEVFTRFAKEETYAAGTLIFDENAKADRFFVIKEGEVGIRKVIDRDESRYKMIAILGAGEFFGEMAVFLGEVRTAQAVAKTDVTLLSLGLTDFARSFKNDPDSAARVMEVFTTVLMKRLNTTTRQLAGIYEMGRLVIAARNEAELTASVMDGLFRIIDSAEAGIFVKWNEFNDEYCVTHQRGIDIDPGTYIAEDDPLVLWLKENRETFLSFELGTDERLPVTEESLYWSSSLLATPFLVQDRLIGFLLILNRQKQNAFSSDHMILLSSIGGYVSVALENLKFIEDEGNRHRLSRAKSSIQH